MVCRRDPVDRVVDLIVAVPVSMAAALREIVPVHPRRLERFVGRNLDVIGRYAARGAGTPHVPTASPVAGVDAALRAEPVVAATEPEVDEASSTDTLTDLPIAGYDQLSARQIVDRLGGLTGAELAIVEEYERLHRRRQTILGRIGQLS